MSSSGSELLVYLPEFRLWALGWFWVLSFWSVFVSRVLGFGFWGLSLCCGSWGLGGLGFGVWGLGIGVLGFELCVLSSGFRSLGFRVLEFRFWVSSFRFGSGFWALGL